MAEQTLDKFIETVMDDAAQQKSKLVREIEIEKKKQIDKSEEKILGDIYLDIQKEIADIQNKASRLISKTSFDCKRELLIKREELSTEVFRKLSAKLCKYTDSAEYVAVIISEIKELLKQYSSSNVSLTLNQKDFTKVKSKIIFNDNVVVNESESILIGGFIFEVPELNIQYNETFDLKLENQKVVFNEISGLSIS